MMTTDRSIAALIISHGRADRVITARELRKAGWTHPIYLVIDDEDEQGDLYRKNFGAENVFVFNKQEIGKTFDLCDTVPNTRSSTFARNACIGIARELGIRYQFQLDDDYNSFRYRFIRDGQLPSLNIKSLDQVVDAMIDFLNVSGAAAVAMSQPGDHIGGAGGIISQKVKRKAMNSFVIDNERPLQFIGRLNEDVNTYVMGGQRGKLFFTIPNLTACQLATQTNAGGMTDTYQTEGTYIKSFMTVMMAPSSVVIKPMGHVGKRLHHKVLWNKAVPKIISDQHKK